MPLLAVITGAAQGIGVGIAEVLASRGLTVALVDIQRDKLLDVRNKIIQNGGDAAVHVADVTDIDSVKALGNEIVLDHGISDILVNNAGVLYFQDFLEGK
jgi:short-subunit dehydrogenase